MEESKRKQLEAQLRQLINAAKKEGPQAGADDASTPVKKIQVIRRRKGKPDQHIAEKLHPQTLSAFHSS